MNPAYVYLQIYRLFDNHTPICADCGSLCDKACCKGDNMGMYLFPNEKSVFDLLSPSWAKVEESDFAYSYNGKNKKTPIVFCNGHCDRYQRPLACRIFPLTPYVTKSGQIDIIVDPRAKSLCPLSYELELSQYDRTFLKNIKRSFNILAKNKEVYAFLYEYSLYLDDYLKFF